MVNKKGWIRIVEASIAILLIFGVILLISNGTREQKERDLTDILPVILEEMSKNQILRNFGFLSIAKFRECSFCQYSHVHEGFVKVS